MLFHGSDSPHLSAGCRRAHKHISAHSLSVRSFLCAQKVVIQPVNHLLSSPAAGSVELLVLLSSWFCSVSPSSSSAAEQKADVTSHPEALVTSGWQGGTGMTPFGLGRVSPTIKSNAHTY